MYLVASLRPSQVHVFVRALPQVWNKNEKSREESFSVRGVQVVCVSNNRADAVDRLLILSNVDERLSNVDEPKMFTVARVLTRHGSCTATT